MNKFSNHQIQRSHLDPALALSESASNCKNKEIAFTIMLPASPNIMFRLLYIRYNSINTQQNTCCHIHLVLIIRPLNVTSGFQKYKLWRPRSFLITILHSPFYELMLTSNNKRGDYSQKNLGLGFRLQNEA